MLAMHMANELLTPVVAGVLALVAAGLLGMACRQTRRSLDPARVPLMGVLGAFVFAAQMINFTLPFMPGTSGHLGGGVLLAIVLGPHAATLVMASILIIQCLIFQDGGLLALGANILNMGVVPCYVGYALYRAVLGHRQGVGAARLYAATFAASVVGVVLGAACVPFETAAAGVITVPLRLFLLTMVGVHLLIGAVEGLITFAVVAYLYRIRPDTLRGAELLAEATRTRVGWPVVAGSLAAVAVVLGGLISHAASAYPDGLEWTYAERPADPHFQPYVDAPDESSLTARTEAFQQRAALLPDYGGDDTLLRTVAGLAGTIVTLAVTYLIARLLRRKVDSEAPTPTRAT